MSAYTVKANNTGSTATPQDVAMSTLTNGLAWGLTGNSGTTAGTNFIGTTDAQDLVFKTNNIECGRIEGNSGQNTSFGRQSLINVTTSNSNTSIGYQALTNQTGGGSNVAIGVYSLEQSLTGIGNVCIGNNSGNTITNGTYNTIIGTGSDVGDANSNYRIALGSLASCESDYQFAIPDNVTTIKFKGIVYTLPTVNAAGVLTNDGSGVLTWS